MIYLRLAFTTLFLAAAALPSAAVPALPHLEKRGTALQLIVQDQPFLVLGGEVHNSSSSDREYIRPIWPRLAGMHLNTVLAPVSWEQFEPKEGHYDFALVDGMLEDARQHHLHLVLLWFGSWKNMVSSYAPSWVRSDPARFALVVDGAGNRLPILSPFGRAAQEADRRAFSALMEHLHRIDQDNTVLMIQVENEVGLSGGQRDHSERANQAYGEPVPPELMEYLVHHPDELTRELKAVWSAAGSNPVGSWEKVFGTGPASSELFMAWHYARYINGVVSAGHAAHPIPLFVNAAIGRENGKIASYPSGGALPLTLNLWCFAAPAIEILSPDIYYGSFSGWCQAYRQAGNPLFIPETRGGEAGAGNALLALGGYGALGISPFGIDNPAPPAAEFVEVYEILENISPLLLSHQADGSIGAAVLNQENPGQAIALGDFTLNVALRHDRRAAKTVDHGYILAIAEQPDRFLLVGKDVQVTFATNGSPPAVVELGRVEEGTFSGGKWVPGRRLNGDEIMLSYDLSVLAANHQTGTGVRLGPEHLTTLKVDVFRRTP